MVIRKVSRAPQTAAQDDRRERRNPRFRASHQRSTVHRHHQDIQIVELFVPYVFRHVPQQACTDLFQHHAILVQPTESQFGTTRDQSGKLSGKIAPCWKPRPNQNAVQTMRPFSSPNPPVVTMPTP